MKKVTRVKHGQKRAYRNSLTLDTRVGHWTLDAELWTLDSGRWNLDARLWTLDTGLWTLKSEQWILDPGPWTLDAGLWTLDKSFGNNGATSIYLFLNSTLIKIFGNFRCENLSTVNSFGKPHPQSNFKKQ